MKRITVYCIVLFCLLQSFSVFANDNNRDSGNKPEHAILIIVDGLSYKTWEKVELPVMEKMIGEGSLIEKVFLPPAAHPTSGSYSEIHTCSIPNPILMAGTVFITKSTKYLQDSFYPKETTAFVANATVYGTIAGNYNLSYQVNGEDDDSINAALEFMRLYKPSFTRIHLQNTGGAGTMSMDAPDSVDWKWNIWAENSPYRKSLAHVDSLLGYFTSGLAKQGILDKTVLIITGDHGQNDTGWHPLELWDSSITTAIFRGAGIKKGVRVPYAELIDFTPTICMLMEVKAPDTSQGRIMDEVFTFSRGNIIKPAEKIKELNLQLAEFRKKKTDALYKIENLSSGGKGNFFYRTNRELGDNFYDMDKFSQWPKFKTIDELLENNRKVIKKLDEVIIEIDSVK